MDHGRALHVALTRSLTADRRRYTLLVQRILGDAADAEDVVQSSWLRLHALDDRVEVRDAGAFLRRLVRNLALDHLRYVRVRRDTGGQMPCEEVLADERPGAEQVMIDRERLRLLRAALDELPPRCREVFELRRVHDLDSATIASRLGITQNAVAKHVRHALQHCQARLAEDNHA